MRALILAVALLTLLPSVHAAQPIGALQEPVTSNGTLGAVAEFTVDATEAAKDWFVVFRTDPNRKFSAEVVDGRGETVWFTNATNGIRPFFPDMAPGVYKLIVNGKGEAQVTSRILRAMNNDTFPERVEETLGATPHAWLFQSAAQWLVRVDGNVTVEWLEVGGARERFEVPANLTADAGYPYVLTLRGDEGASYVVTMDEDESFVPEDAPGAAADGKDAPAPGLAGLALAAVGAALVARRARRR